MKGPLQRKTTVQVATNLASSIVDPETVQRYGTSVDENMTREYQKQLREKYHKLKQEFFEINKDSNSFISLEELIAFFNDRDKRGRKFDMHYIAKVFDLMDKDKDEKLTVNEFVEAYMETEERIRMHNVKYSNMVNEQKENIEKYEKKLKECAGEEYYSNGLSTKAMLNVTLLEAKDLIAGWSGSLDSYALLTLENQSRQSKLQLGKVDPAWNEDFAFEVTSFLSVLKAEIYSKQTLGTISLLGSVQIDLQSLSDQQRTDRWYNIALGDKATGNGQLRLKAQFIHSKKKYFTDLIQATTNKIQSLEQKRTILSDYIEYIKEPFGVIHLGDINDNLKGILYSEDQIIKEIESNRKSVYAKRATNAVEGMTFTATLNNIIGGNKRAEIKWGSLSKIMMYTSIVLSIIVLLERPDFVNLSLSVAIWILFVYDKSNDIEDYLLPLIISIGVSLGYDLLWLIIKFTNFARGSLTDYELGIKKWVYFFSFLNFIVKIVLLVVLWLLKKKKSRAKAEEA